MKDHVTGQKAIEKSIKSKQKALDEIKKSKEKGYKKKDVYTVLFKSIETKKIENACNWLTECLCSGYLEETWQKLLCFSSNIITINNPHLPNYLYKKNVLLYNIVNNIDEFAKANKMTPEDMAKVIIQLVKRDDF